MGDFGKRTVNARQEPPPRLAFGAQSAPTWSDQISKRDLKALERGQLPVWTNMSQLKLLSLALFVAAMVLGALAYYGPELVRDLRHAGTFRVADDLRATEGTCKRYVFLVSLCSVKIHSVTSERSTSSTEFLMFFRGGDGAAMIPVRSSVDASAVSIQYAVSDVLLNRILSLLGITLFFGWIAWMFLDCVRKGRYKDGPGHEAIRQYVALHSSPG
jgi:FtsH-binding integral membrane protein